MLRKTAILYISFFAIAHFLAGCCNCPPSPHYRIKWTQPKLRGYSYTIDSGRITVMLDTSNDFSSGNYMMDVTMGYELLAANTPRSSGLTTQAYACKCDPVISYTPDHKLSSLKVFTIKAYDNSHPAMTEVTEYFKSPKYTNGNPDGLGNLELNLMQSTYYNTPGSFQLYLSTRPTIGTVHQFKVELKLDNDSTITALTPALMF
jgi:hypothetical protein